MLREAVRAAISEGNPFDLHFRQRRPDASQRILRSRGGPVFGPGGVLTGIEGFAQDVTELKRAEDHQRAVAALGQAALGGLPLDELMERATEIVAATLELDHVSVFEIAQRATSTRGCCCGRARLAARADRAARAEIGRASHAGYTLMTGEPVVVEDWEREERFQQPAVLAAAGVRSGACVMIGDPPYGALAAHSVHPGAVGPEHVTFLHAVANVLDSAVARLRAEEEIAEQAAARGRLVAQALDAEERTRREISALLHDGPLQDLLALNQELLRLEDGGEHLDRARTGIGRAIGALREIMVDLHPVAFEVAGLESALGAVADQQARQGAFACELEDRPVGRRRPRRPGDRARARAAHQRRQARRRLARARAGSADGGRDPARGGRRRRRHPRGAAGRRAARGSHRARLGASSGSRRSAGPSPSPPLPAAARPWP